jgi:hypothetical protein
MTVSAERKAQIRAILYPKSKPPPAKPKIVTSDGTTISDAVVRVAPEDPNARGNDRIVEVRRSDWVTINLVEYERQCADRAEEKRFRRQLDPYRLGLYGPIDDDE